MELIKFTNTKCKKNEANLNGGLLCGVACSGWLCTGNGCSAGLVCFDGGGTG